MVHLFYIVFEILQKPVERKLFGPKRFCPNICHKLNKICWNFLFKRTLFVIKWLIIIMGIKISSYIFSSGM